MQHALNKSEAYKSLIGRRTRARLLGRSRFGCENGVALVFRVQGVRVFTLSTWCNCRALQCEKRGMLD